MKAEIKDALGLSDEQCGKIKGVLTDTVESVVTKFPDISENLESLVEIVTKKKLGWRLKAKKHKDALEKFRNAKEEAKEKAIDELGTILTTEQKVKIVLFKASSFAEAKAQGELGPMGKLFVVLKAGEGELELKEKQKGKLVTLMESCAEKAIAYVEKMLPLVDALKKEWDGDKDEAKLDNSLKTIRAAVQESKNIRKEVMEQLKKILEPEQMVKLMVALMSLQ